MPSVLITGASRGLGLEFARQFAARGWLTFSAVRNPAQAVPGAIAVPLDVADTSAYPSVLEAVRRQTSHLDVLIHNAGIFAPGEEGLETMVTEAMLRVFQVNVVAPLALTRALLPVLGAGSKIVGLTSGAGVMQRNANSPGGQYSYGASKAALHHALRRLHFELFPKGMIVCGMAPGFVLTDMTRSSLIPPPLLPEESVRGMIRVIDSLGSEDAGEFMAHDGSLCEWMLC